MGGSTEWYGGTTELTEGDPHTDGGSSGSGRGPGDGGGGGGGGGGSTPTLAQVLAQGADANSTIITGVADPSAAQDAATKNYVDNAASIATSDTGLLTFSYGNTTQSDEYGEFSIMPPFTNSQGHYLSQAPPTGGDWIPLQVVTAADLLQVFAVQSLIDTWDDVDYSGRLLVWDLLGANLIACTFSGFVRPSSSPALVALTQEQLIGSDLSITEDTLSVTSAAGGTYNVQVKATASWD